MPLLTGEQDEEEQKQKDLFENSSQENAKVKGSAFGNLMKMH
jgi:hypothetical protein